MKSSWHRVINARNAWSWKKPHLFRRGLNSYGGHCSSMKHICCVQAAQVDLCQGLQQRLLVVGPNRRVRRLQETLQGVGQPFT